MSEDLPHANGPHPSVPDGVLDLAPSTSDTSPHPDHPDAQAAIEDWSARFRGAQLREATGALPTVQPATPPDEPTDEPTDAPARDSSEPIPIPPHLRRIFLEETAEDLEKLRAALLAAEQSADPAPHYHTMKQVAHKIKGSSAMYRYSLLADVALTLEDWLKCADAHDAAEQRDAIQRRITEGAALLDALLAAATQGRDPEAHLVEHASALAAALAPQQMSDPYAASVTSLRPTAPSTSSPTTSQASVQARGDGTTTPDTEPNLTVHVPSREVDTLVTNLSEAAINRALDAMVRADLVMLDDELRRTRTRLRDRTALITAAYLHSSPHHTALPSLVGTPAAPESSGQGDQSDQSDQSIEADLALRSLGEVVDDLGAHVSQLSALLGTLAQTARTQTDLMRAIRDQAVRMRLVPFTALESRLQVTTRVGASECGKVVELTLEGGDTHIDREIVDALAEPLTQIVTNAIIHAIELPEERVRLGKSPRGHIHIKARLRGSEIHLTIADDGRGTDPRTLVTTALEQGILTVEQARALTPAQALNLMFEPGLTTQNTAGLLSGRGIGLDQVRTTVRALRGQIAVQSSMGQGTIFRMRLPISQTLLTVLEVSCAGERYAIPLSLLTRVLSLARSGPQPADAPPYRAALSDEERVALIERLASQVRTVSGESASLDETRVFRLGALLGQPTGHTAEEVALLLEVEDGLVAVLVDSVGTEREVVVRPLLPYLRRPSVWGGAITPEGDTLLLLDLPTLVRQYGPRAEVLGTPREGLAGSGAAGETRAFAAPPPGTRVLVVDDSPTVRHNVTTVLKQAGYQTTEARDGVEAIGHLAALPVDVVVLDIEMPELGGIDLLALLRGNPHFAEVPVVVLSSRDTSEMRQRARELGVRIFLSKPCPPEHLLSAVRRVATK